RRDRRAAVALRARRRAHRRRTHGEGLDVGARGRRRRGDLGALPPTACVRLSSVEELLATLERGRAHDDGETLDLLAHGLQCAELLRAAAPRDLELQVAGLLHDLGTVLEADRPATHAVTGAAAVEGLLGSGVAALIADHDQAKRYLVTTDPAYRSCL